MIYTVLKQERIDEVSYLGEYETTLQQTKDAVVEYYNFHVRDKYKLPKFPNKDSEEYGFMVEDQETGAINSLMIDNISNDISVLIITDRRTNSPVITNYLFIKGDIK